MTAVIDTYTSLITSEHRDRPKYRAMIEQTLQPAVDNINLVESIVAKYDLDVAAGVQLDVVGQWVGIARTLRVPIPNVYFSFNISGLGWNQGIWFNPGDPTEGLITMDDPTYRLMIKAKIAANTWDGSLEDANEKLANLFPGGSVEMKDNLNMSVTYNIAGDAPSTLFFELVQAGYIPFTPAGVRLV